MPPGFAARGQVEEFLSEIYRQSGELDGQSSASGVFKAFRSFVLDHTQTAEICENVDLDHLNTHQILALLTATLPVRGVVGARADFSAAAEARLRDTESDWQDLLAGLL